LIAQLVGWPSVTLSDVKRYSDIAGLLERLGPVV